MNIYEERQQKKQAIDDYREAAKKIAAISGPQGISVNEHANVQVMPDGAFVEVIMWVPKGALPA